MTNTKKIFLCLTVICVIGIWQYTKHSTPLYVLNVAKQNLAAQGIVMDYGRATLDFPLSVTLDELGMLFPTPMFPIPLRITKATAAINPFSVITGTVRLEGELALYDGKTTFSIGVPWIGSNADLSIEATELHLANHPTLEAFGIDGLTSLTVDGSQSGQSQKLSLRLLAKNVSYRGGHSLEHGLFITPAIHDGTISCDGLLLDDLLRIPVCRLQSSLGNVDVSARLTIDAQRASISRGVVSGTVQLTPEGVQKLAGYFAIAANRDPDEEIANWKFEVTFTGARQPRVSIVPSK